MSKLQVKVVQKKADGQEWYEGSVTIPGLKGSVKLARRSDGNTKFSTRSAVNGAAKSLLTTLNAFSEVDFGQDAAKKSPAVKKAAKKTAKKSAPATPATTATSDSSSAWN